MTWKLVAATRKKDHSLLYWFYWWNDFLLLIVEWVCVCTVCMSGPKMNMQKLSEKEIRWFYACICCTTLISMLTVIPWVMVFSKRESGSHSMLNSFRIQSESGLFKSKLRFTPLSPPFYVLKKSVKWCSAIPEKREFAIFSPSAFHIIPALRPIFR